MGTREDVIADLAAQYWEDTSATGGNRPTAFAIAQKMKKAGICNYDMDCYRQLLTAVTKKYRK